MSRRIHACVLCAGTAADGARLPPRKAVGVPLLCTDCKAAAGRFVAPARLRRVQTRASYRAALRHRNASPQSDLVDLIVRAP